MILQCKDLTIGYDNHKTLENINLTILPGEYVCIFGDNGSGKSTLVKTILGLIPEIKGSIVFGENLSRKSVEYLLKQENQRNDEIVRYRSLSASFFF